MPGPTPNPHHHHGPQSNFSRLHNLIESPYLYQGWWVEDHFRGASLGGRELLFSDDAHLMPFFTLSVRTLSLYKLSTAVSGNTPSVT
ncbi:hypothetical protein E2C01_004746 [Portunus trituberculatus]|uniref:Uncharacterized protein n=1 Tax=Portunus trituberculatus TaxID=210409 RepID=A0A5B7CSH0_PORTR|nr:hypothetical protein [Portunus trituberculatus]